MRTEEVWTDEVVVTGETGKVELHTEDVVLTDRTGEVRTLDTVSVV